MKKTIGVLMVLSVLMGCGKETASDLPVITPELSGGTPDLEIFTPAGNVVDAISTMLESVVTDSSSLSSPIDESIWFLETGINYALSNAVDSLDVLVVDEALEFQLPLTNDSVNHSSLREAFVVLYERVDSLVNHHEANFRFADVMYVDHGASLDLQVRIVLTAGYTTLTINCNPQNDPDYRRILYGHPCGGFAPGQSGPYSHCSTRSLRESRNLTGAFVLNMGFNTNVIYFNDNTSQVNFRLINTDYLPGRCNSIYGTQASPPGDHNNSTSLNCEVNAANVCISQCEVLTYSDRLIDHILNICGKKFHPVFLYMPPAINPNTGLGFWQLHNLSIAEIVEKDSQQRFSLGQ